MRFKGIDPERFFNFIYPYIRWFFTVPAMICCIILALAALTLVLVQFDVFQSRLPRSSPSSGRRTGCGWRSRCA